MSTRASSYLQEQTPRPLLHPHFPPRSPLPSSIPHCTWVLPVSCIPSHLHDGAFPLNLRGLRIRLWIQVPPSRLPSSDGSWLPVQDPACASNALKSAISIAFG